MAEVAARTKIPVRQLAALEAEEYDKVPGGIFVRGHIRATAKVVGLDPAELTEHFEEETSPRSLAPEPQEVASFEDRGPRLRMAAEPAESAPNRPLIAAALLIVVSIVLAIAWFGRERDLPPSSRNGTPPQVATTVAALSSTTAGSRGDLEPRAVGTTGTIRTDGRAPADGLALSLRAERVCWLALTVDGQRVAYRMLREGETVTAHMHQRASVRTGDAGALLLSIGRGPARPLGASGAVRTIEFTPDDYARLIAR
jgi:cytoskeletal protein RodZ